MIRDRFIEEKEKGTELSGHDGILESGKEQSGVLKKYKGAWRSSLDQTYLLMAASIPVASLILLPKDGHPDGSLVRYLEHSYPWIMKVNFFPFKSLVTAVV
jgi:hypothetical protein